MCSVQSACATECTRRANLLRQRHARARYDLHVVPTASESHVGFITLVRLTANHHQLPTHTFESCPKLDMLFVPGPPPDYVPPPDLAAFLLRRAAEVDVLMADCSGPCVLAALGLLDGKRATVNKEAIGAMEEAFPKVKWERKERWVVDGKTWTAGGAVAGMDMMVAFLKSERFGLGELAEMPQKLIEFDPRGQFYQ